MRFAKLSLPWFLVSLVLSILVLLYVNGQFANAFANSSGGKHSATHSSHLTAQQESPDASAPNQGQRIAQGINSTGFIYAPRDVVDMTRLVLEVSRENTAHTNHVIERATQVIVVLFTVLAVVGTLIGYHKLKDVDEKIKTIVTDAKNQTDEYVVKLNQHTNDMRALSHATLELTAGRVWIDQATYNTTADPLIKSNQFQRAIKAIEETLKKYGEILKMNQLALLRAHLDLGFAKKRLGLFVEAYGHSEKGLEIIAESQNHGEESARILGYFQYNAACYACLAGKDHQIVFSHMLEAIKTDPSYKLKFRAEDDLKKLHTDADFIRYTS